MALAARSGDQGEEAIAAFDAGSIALAAREHTEAVQRLDAALGSESRRLPRALARLRLCEARLAAGDLEGAARELRRFPFEPVGAADAPGPLVPRLQRMEGLVAAASGDRELALRRLSEAETGWRRALARSDVGDPVAASLVDLGRAPVGGLVEPGAELGQVLAERALLLAEDGRRREAEDAVDEAEGLADDLGFDGYRDALSRVRGARRRGVEHAEL